MSKLVIVESPSKAKTIEKYLGKDYIVRASVGHVRDLPKSNKDAIDVDHGFTPRYVVSPGKEKVLSDIKKLADKSSEILLATDPDREGEAIAWHIKEALDLPTKKTKRVVFYEITEDAVNEALKHPRKIDQDLKEAQEARRVLDRLMGYDLSGLIWKKVRYGLSAGRVQSPALRILMEREREIRSFVPEDYWVISAEVKAETGDVLPLVCTEEPKTKKDSEDIIKNAEHGDWLVKEKKETKAKRKPRAPFTTSTLQQVASTRLGFSPANTMRVAQKLYEAGHITYMRTDSFNLSKQALAQAGKVVEKEFGKDYVEIRAYKTKSKNAQEAHEAIRPTNLAKKSAGNTAEQKKLYELIWTRTISSQMKDAEILRTKVIANTKENNIPDFSVNGSRVIFDGWLRADTRARGEDIELPKISEGDPLKLLGIESEAKQTEPPNRYTEAGLVKELEKRGIGRPSTYASIIKTIIDRGYVEKDGKTLHPTDTGDVVSSFLEKNFTDVISDDFTADMEDRLDDIARGEREYEKTLKEFYDPFSKDIKKKDKEIGKITDLGDAPKEFPCPKCGSSMIIKLGKAGKFMSCSRFPDCDGARTIDGKEVEPDKPLGTHPETGQDIYVLNGRYGPYVELRDKEEENSKEDKKKKKKTKEKPRRASIPADKEPEDVTVADAVKYLSLPKDLGEHPETGKVVKAGIGRFGPYIVHDGDFRSLKEDNVYEIELPRALEILAEEKKPPRGSKVAKKLGRDPKSKKDITVYESKSGLFLKKGLKRIYLPDDTKLDKFELEDALKLLK